MSIYHSISHLTLFEHLARLGTRVATATSVAKETSLETIVAKETSIGISVAKDSSLGTSVAKETSLGTSRPQEPSLRTSTAKESRFLDTSDSKATSILETSEVESLQVNRVVKAINGNKEPCREAHILEYGVAKETCVTRNCVGKQTSGLVSKTTSLASVTMAPSVWLVICLLLLGSVLNVYAAKIVNQVDLKLIDLYKKRYGEDSIVKVYHRNKKHYATKEPLVHYEILVVSEDFYGKPMVDRMLEVREMAISNVPSFPGTYNIFTCYVPTFEEWRNENINQLDDKGEAQIQAHG